MITGIDIRGYRGLSKFEMKNLGLVNLLVGKNNGGKTSVLEAIHLLVSGANPSAIWSILSRRGERIIIEQPSRRTGEQELEVTHLFHGHAPTFNQSFSITAHNERPARTLNCTLVEHSDKEKNPKEELPKQYLWLSSGTRADQSFLLPLSVRLGMTAESLDFARRSRASESRVQNPSWFITSESLTPDTLSFLWNDIALTDSQQMVVKALQFVEERIEAIAPQVVSPAYYYPYNSRGGFIVRLRGEKTPVPIGSLGDGTWRILALAMSLAKAKDGVLLVDEIDTGLHYTVMSAMWSLIAETARTFNVQVFATTHSYDCVQSLASICTGRGANDVTIQRIESRKEHAVPYSESEIIQTALNHIEVR